MARAVLEIIQEALRNYGGRQKATGSHMMIQCPFHDDDSPSCGVNINPDGKVPVGVFNCLGCQAKGHWNLLADKIGAEKIKDGQNVTDRIGGGPTQEDDFDLLGHAETNKKNVSILSLKDMPDRESLKVLMVKAGVEAALPWTPVVDWRGFPGSFLASLNKGTAWIDSTRGRQSAVFIAWVNNRAVGLVTAHWEKVKGKTSYFTSKGSWILTRGLLFYDQARSMIDRMDCDVTFVVLTEGPRDALRLLACGIPAVAILGSKNMTARKLGRVFAIADCVYVMPDNDKAGTQMWHLTVECMKELSGLDEEEIGRMLRRIRLPKKYDEKGELIEMDPFNAPKKIIKKLKQAFDKRHGKGWRKAKFWTKEETS